MGALQRTTAVITAALQALSLIHIFPVVRRMTGGGTVYHDLGNINYTFISNSDRNLSYDRFLDPVINALCALGLNAHKNSVCDIAIDGLKISGSAQRTCKGRVLHHGTLLFDCDLTLLDYLTAKTKNQSIDTKGTLSTVSRVTNISAHLKDCLLYTSRCV